jgi:hypothetical protein
VILITRHDRQLRAGAFEQATSNGRGGTDTCIAVVM